jgi:hypothetical protein
MARFFQVDFRKCILSGSQRSPSTKDSATLRCACATRSTGAFQSSLKRETPASLREAAGLRFSGKRKKPAEAGFLIWCPKDHLIWLAALVLYD